MLVSDTSLQLYVRFCGDDEGWLDFYHVDEFGRLMVLFSSGWARSSFADLEHLLKASQSRAVTGVKDLVTVLNQYHWDHIAAEAVWEVCPPEWRPELRTQCRRFKQETSNASD